MVKEKIENNLDSYQEKIRLIKRLVQEINEEFGLEDKNQISCTPDQIVVPLVHQNGERVEHVLSTFKSEKQDILKTPFQFEEDRSIQWFNTSNIVKSLLKYGSKFDSHEPQLIKKCLEKIKSKSKK